MAQSILASKRDQLDNKQSIKFTEKSVISKQSQNQGNKQTNAYSSKNQNNSNKFQSIKQILQPSINALGQLQTCSLNTIIEKKIQLEKPLHLSSLQQTLKFETSQKNRNVDMDNQQALIDTRHILDEDIRKYSCGCGKNYTSYHTLYTHIQKKHAGTPPEGTINGGQKPRGNSTKRFSSIGSQGLMGAMSSKSRRGRPRKFEYNLPDDVATNNPVLSSLAEQVEMIKNQEQGDKQKNKEFYLSKLEESDIQKSLDAIEEEPFQGSYDPIQILIQQQIFHQNNVFEIMQKIQKGECVQEFSQYIVCDKIIAVFLLNVANFVNEKLFQIIVIFFKNLRECTNKFLYTHIKENPVEKIIFIKETLKKPSNKRQLQYTEIEPGWYLPLIGEHFILKYLPENCQHMDQTFAATLFQDFCKFMLKYNLTKLKVEFTHTKVGNTLHQISKLYN